MTDQISVHTRGRTHPRFKEIETSNLLIQQTVCDVAPGRHQRGYILGRLMNVSCGFGANWPDPLCAVSLAYSYNDLDLGTGTPTGTIICGYPTTIYLRLHDPDIAPHLPALAFGGGIF